MGLGALHAVLVPDEATLQWIQKARQESTFSRRTSLPVEYFELPYTRTATTRYLIYFCNDHDGVVTDKDGKILSFAQSEALREFAKKKKWKIKPALPLLDLDQVKAWTSDFDLEKLDCPTLYRAWNLLGDLASSVGRADDFTGYQDDAMAVHEELFWGCNLPGSAPADRPYRARLSEDDVDTLQEVFETGLGIFVAGVKDFE
jgi:hypothetical protein